MAGNLLINISQDERERAILRSRRMYETDMQSNLATAEDRGERRGLAEGRTEGLAAGRTEGTLSALQSLMERMGLSLDQAMEALNIPETERPAYRGMLSGG